MNLDLTAPLLHVKELYRKDSPLFVLDDSFEDVWLPFIGPSTCALVRYLARHLEDGQLQIEPEELGYRIGQPGRYQLKRTIDRAVQFHFIDIAAPSAFGVWTSAHIPQERKMAKHHDRKVSNWSEGLARGIA